MKRRKWNGGYILCFQGHRVKNYRGLPGTGPAERYEEFLRTRKKGQMTAANPKAVYACVNYGEAVCPDEIGEQSICISEDIGKVLGDLGTKNV